MSTKQVIVIRKDLNMRKGKIASQTAHASMAFITEQLQEDPDDTPRPAIYIPYIRHDVKLEIVEQEWIDNSFTKVIVGCEDEAEFHEIAERANQAGLKVHKIKDNGRTEFHGVPTWTALAIGPDEDEFIDKITGHLTLL